MTHCELIEQGNRQPEHERTPEMLPVEPDRVGDELADRAIGRRDCDLAGDVHDGEATASASEAMRRAPVS
jgi:hypothetical protein